MAPFAFGRFEEVAITGDELLKGKYKRPERERNQGCSENFYID